MEIHNISEQGLWQLYMELDYSLGADDDEAPFSYEVAKKWAPLAYSKLQSRYSTRKMERVSTYAVRNRCTGDELITLARDEWPLLQRILGDASLDS